MWKSIALTIAGVTSLQFFLYCVVYALALYLLGTVASALLVIVSLVSVYVIVYVLKVATRVQRRDDAQIVFDHPDRAFPSGHAAAVAFLIPVVTYTAPWGLPMITLLAMSALTGVVMLSRLSLRVHTMGQVVAGALIGTLVPVAIIICTYTHSLFGMV